MGKMAIIGYLWDYYIIMNKLRYANLKFWLKLKLLYWINLKLIDLFIYGTCSYESVCVCGFMVSLTCWMGIEGDLDNWILWEFYDSINIWACARSGLDFSRLMRNCWYQRKLVQWIEFWEIFSTISCFVPSTKTVETFHTNEFSLLNFVQFKFH